MVTEREVWRPSWLGRVSTAGFSNNALKRRVKVPVCWGEELCLPKANVESLTEKKALVDEKVCSRFWQQACHLGICEKRNSHDSSPAVCLNKLPQVVLRSAGV